MDVLIHLAAIPDDAEPGVLLLVNVTGLSNMLSVCRSRNRGENQIKRLVVASSGKLWVGHGQVLQPIKIHEEMSPRCLYAATKSIRRVRSGGVRGGHRAWRMPNDSVTVLDGALVHQKMLRP